MCVLYFAHRECLGWRPHLQEWIFSSLPLTPPKIFPNCLDITFHTSKQEAVFPAFKNRPSANPWGCCLINSLHAGPASHPALRGPPGGGAPAPAWPDFLASSFTTDRSRKLAGLHFSPCRMGWSFHHLFPQSLPFICTNMWGNGKAGCYLGQWSLEGTTVINKFNCTALLFKQFWRDTDYTSAANLGACLERGRDFTLRNDKIFSQALSCFINACLIWGERKTGWSIMVVLYALNWHCFGTKNNFCTRVLTASLSHFPSPAAALPGREGRGRGTVGPSPVAEAVTRGL